MNQIPNVTIALARCRYTRQPYGIRLEQVSRELWAGTWAFAINEDRARREGYDRSELRGSFGLTDEYPGCPYCRAQGLLACGECGQLACWNKEGGVVTCVKCGSRGEVRGSIDHLRAGGDL